MYKYLALWSYFTQILFHSALLPTLDQKLRHLPTMQFNVVFVATALLASASLAMSSTIITFAGADCTGTVETENFNVGSNVCLTDGGNSVKSISYSGVGGQIQFFVSGGGHDNCSNGPSLTLGGGSGCANAPAGFNWESVFII